jgi:hypothetical protein
MFIDGSAIIIKETMDSKAPCPGFPRPKPEENPFGDEDAKRIENLVGHWTNIHSSVDQKKGEKGGVMF